MQHEPGPASAPHPVLVVGSAALDSVATPAGRADDEVGGSALFFAAAASIFAPVRVVGVVGEDFPWERIEFLHRRGVDLTALETAPGLTFRWRGVYHPDLEGRDTLATELNVFERFQPRILDVHRGTPIVFLGNIDPELQASVHASLERPALTAVDTMNFWIERKPEALREVLRLADLAILNEGEARQLTGETQLPRAARAVREFGPRRVVVKLGPHGALLWDGEGFAQCPALPLEVPVDPTGAGDSFAGGYLGYLATRGALRPQDFRDALVYGNVVASFAVESFGLRALSRADRDVVERRRRALLETLPGGWN